jgi:hypothetical protein
MITDLPFAADLMVSCLRAGQLPAAEPGTQSGPALRRTCSDEFRFLIDYPGRGSA